MEETPMPQAYSYVRWSSDPQSLGDSERRQLEKSRAYAVAHNLELVEEITDTGISAFRGRNVEEGGLAKFLAAVRTKKIKRGSYLLFENFDRLNRQKPLRAINLFSEIIDAGIIIVTLQDQKQYSEANESDIGSLISSIVSMSLAHEESAKKSIRLAAAWAGKRAKKEPMTARVPAWLQLPRIDPNDRTKKRAFVIDQSRAEIIKKIFELSASGLGNYLIVKKLNADKVPTFGSSKVWACSSIGKILGNRATIGEFQPCVYSGKTRVPEGLPISNYFPRIISNELFHRAENSRQQRLWNGKPIGGKKSNFYNLFAGILKCAYCNSAVHFHDKGKGHGDTLLQCHSAYSGSGCKSKSWSYPHFERSFIQFVDTVDWSSIGSTDKSNNKISKLENEIIGLKGEETSIEKKLAKAFEIAQHGKIDFIVKTMRELERQQHDLKTKITTKEKELEALNRNGNNFKNAKQEIQSLQQRLNNPMVRAEATTKIKSLVETIYLAPIGYKNTFLSFLDNEDRNFVGGSLQSATKKLFVVHFRDIEFLTAVAWHPEDEESMAIFNFGWSMEEN
jgi:DNA invertase Pin-like site-specific DNA recombinase